MCAPRARRGTLPAHRAACTTTSAPSSRRRSGSAFRTRPARPTTDLPLRVVRFSGAALRYGIPGRRVRRRSRPDHQAPPAPSWTVSASAASSASTSRSRRSTTAWLSGRRRPAPDPACGGGLPGRVAGPSGASGAAGVDSTGPTPGRAGVRACSSEEPGRATGALDFNLLLNRYHCRAVPLPPLRFGRGGTASHSRARPSSACGPSGSCARPGMSTFWAAGGEDGPLDTRHHGDHLCHSLPRGRRFFLRRRLDSESRTSDANSGTGGRRVRLQGSLGVVRLALQMDIGFGDVITPETRAAELSHPARPAGTPRLWTYPREDHGRRESSRAMVSRGADNSRVKDIWDIACLARRFVFDGDILRDRESPRLSVAAETSFAGERPEGAASPGYYGDHCPRRALAGAATPDRDRRRRSNPSLSTRAKSWGGSWGRSASA